MENQFLDKNGVQILWTKTKQLVESSAEAHYIRIRDHSNFSSMMWRLVCVFPVNNALNKCSATIDGKMGGWTSDNSYLIHAIVMNRDGAVGYGTRSGPINPTTDFSILELYKNNFDNKAYLYVRAIGHFSFDFVLRTSGEDTNGANGISIRWNNSSWTATNPGTSLWNIIELPNVEGFKTINNQSILGSGNISTTDSTKMPLSGGSFTGNVSITGSKSLQLNGTAKILGVTSWKGDITLSNTIKAEANHVVTLPSVGGSGYWVAFITTSSVGVTYSANGPNGSAVGTDGQNVEIWLRRESLGNSTSIHVCFIAVKIGY